MRAVVAHGADDFRVEEVPDPTVGEGELLVEVRAAAATFPDALLVQDQADVTALGVGEVKFTGQILPSASKVVYNIQMKRVIEQTGRPLVELVEVFNQNDEVVLACEHLYLVEKRS